MNWQKSITHYLRYNISKDIIYNILLQIPRILRHIYNKWSILIIQYKSTLNLHCIWIYNCIWIYPIMQLISKFIQSNWYIYIYIYELYVFCLLQHCRNTYTRWSHWFHIQIIFSSWFYLIIVTSRNSLPNCEHDPSYQ